MILPNNPERCEKPSGCGGLFKLHKCQGCSDCQPAEEGKSVFTNKLKPNCPTCGLSFGRELNNDCKDTFHGHATPQGEAEYRPCQQGYKFECACHFDDTLTKCAESCNICPAILSERTKVVRALVVASKKSRVVGGGGEFYDGPGAIYNKGWEAAHDANDAALLKAAREMGVEI